jgi:uncharacterized protein YneF (UPF0154 family)
MNKIAILIVVIPILGFVMLTMFIVCKFISKLNQEHTSENFTKLNRVFNPKHNH